ncbi:tRNA (uridine(34)/cytosine(34)/5-carboxymethylaminomethyluridine(34)-2'-O)-methyltransferase TrmL [Candidatus Methylopumilus universalis]|jgi:tRNA (cytidine/uridine-2'-O-)-methyltransferase|uniref:tRNA (uridine(34)/cytosine(34)/5- carboxymethylaminomethyluridine(34)-2'-O)- methyltransferase TrmL n=1 Tax=Candidatus Methylopumilus universalis TaxID=2588536 RepID=UPI001124902A|nr:tRNA (uridine(34)/cytosine(34)/5-carboxymethylaminomethyluridine(34)-2'-O)-methyltransferase TrmL [Candidatus Methylopumilus universalis]QDC97362.1 tRNA (uridine(34)/cytosine(34)/5-carboxymethylaminomethyluridine(34)-2'-O)-methyltransferase TrmL [Candidatus Methylopumilus universalis]
MFSIALFEPEIPPNTGNIIRLCANTGTQLHLIEPLGFSLDDKQLLRAGLDYHEYAPVKTYPNFSAFESLFNKSRMFAVTTKGGMPYHEVSYKEGDIFLFGPETRGLPESIRSQFDHDKKIRIPMAENSRSLNLSNAAAILLYEAWRQNGFKGGA